MYDKILVHAGKELNDPRVLTDVGDVPVQEIRDCGVDDDRLMNIISESVKAVMQQVSNSVPVIKKFHVSLFSFVHFTESYSYRTNNTSIHMVFYMLPSSISLARGMS